ncbi:hypothetical protein EDB83DRAFT_2230813, partial [Lactarius deliciosus]
TRWNSTHAMIKRARILRKAIDAWLFEFKELRSLLLTSREWDLLGQYKELLEVSKRFTKVPVP